MVQSQECKLKRIDCVNHVYPGFQIRVTRSVIKKDAKLFLNTKRTGIGEDIKLCRLCEIICGVLEKKEIR